MTCKAVVGSLIVMIGFTTAAGTCTVAGHGGMSDLAGLGGIILGFVLVPLGLHIMTKQPA